MCKRLYEIPRGQRITLVKAYQELWNSRYTKPPIDNINSLNMEVIEKEVTRSWRVERTLKDKHPTPARYHHIHPWPPVPYIFFPRHRFFHIFRGILLFYYLGNESSLYCDIYTDSGHTERVWTSDAVPNWDQTYSPLLSTSYLEDGQEVLVVIVGR